jgi:DeoR family glycerol-3-phosphate regulon repressor
MKGMPLTETLNTSRRLDRIVELVSSHGFLTVDALTHHFEVTAQTIRRDLNLLDSQGRINRYRGGAGLPSSIENMEYTRRQVANLEAKQRIAARAAQDVPERSSLFINIGTTTEQVARALTRHANLSVITNNLNVAITMSQRSDCRVVMAGGNVRNRDGGIVGATTREMLEQFRADIGIIGISGIDTDGSLYDYDMDEVACAQAIISNSRRVFLVADHSKFGRPALVRVGSLGQINALYTDAPPPAGIRAILNAHDVKLHIATEEESSDHLPLDSKKRNKTEQTY